jgi:signal transduction histidine kinase
MSTERFSRVLVVEDSAADLQLLCDILQGEGFQVIGCGSATEGLRHVKASSFGVAIVDLRLPDLSGTQLLERIRGCDEQVRVIIYTGAASYDSIKEALNLGAFAYVEKLSDPSELLRHVHRACRERVDRYALDLERAVDERTEKLARSNYELENFAFVVAHDLRSPLLTISGYSQLLQEEYASRLEVSGNEYIAQIVDGVTRMNRMIEDLLDYSRVGRSEHPLELVEIPAVITQAMANLEASIWEQKARIQFGAMPEVLGDQTQLVQLFQNLIGNAIKFRRDVSPLVHVTAADKNSHWEFAVEDNGIGIAKKHFDRLFHIFQRLQGREYPGTGIGLAICKKIVERHGGQIWLDSVVGQGTTFFFTLPKVVTADGLDA